MFALCSFAEQGDISSESIWPPQFTEYYENTVCYCAINIIINSVFCNYVL